MPDEDGDLGNGSRSFVRLSFAGEAALRKSIQAMAEFANAVETGEIIFYTAAAQATTTIQAASLKFPSALSRNPLETLDALAKRLFALSSANPTWATHLDPITRELHGLRQDMAEMFYEIKLGKLETATAYAAAAVVTERNREDTNVRLDRLEIDAE